MERPDKDIKLLREYAECCTVKVFISNSIRRLLEYVDELETLGLQLTEEVLKYLDEVEHEATNRGN